MQHYILKYSAVSRRTMSKCCKKIFFVYQENIFVYQTIFIPSGASWLQSAHVDQLGKQ